MDVQRMLDVRITSAEPNCLSGTPDANHSLLCRDVGRTINSAAYTSNTAMTVESCVAYCTSNGYQYAGVEYYQECCKSWSSALRGDHVASRSSMAPPSSGAPPWLKKFKNSH